MSYSYLDLKSIIHLIKVIWILCFSWDARLFHCYGLLLTLHTALGHVFIHFVSSDTPTLGHVFIHFVLSDTPTEHLLSYTTRYNIIFWIRHFDCYAKVILLWIVILLNSLENIHMFWILFKTYMKLFISKICPMKIPKIFYIKYVKKIKIKSSSLKNILCKN